jgi:hypothetical protein
MYATYPDLNILVNLIILLLFDEQYRVMKLLLMQFSPITCHYIPLWFKYSPEDSVLKYLRSTNNYCSEFLQQ